uniref:Uncharacterized protein n=1 Tax=Fagus sylvatica TaxID=28930 RepID=A0A2N9IQA6_FAGSY
MATFTMTPPIPDSTPRVSASLNPPTRPPICHQEPTAANPSFLDNLYDEDNDKDREFSPFEVGKRTPLRKRKRDGLILWSDYTFIEFCVVLCANNQN